VYFTEVTLESDDSSQGFWQCASFCRLAATDTVIDGPVGDLIRRGAIRLGGQRLQLVSRVLGGGRSPHHHAVFTREVAGVAEWQGNGAIFLLWKRPPLGACRSILTLQAFQRQMDDQQALSLRRGVILSVVAVFLGTVFLQEELDRFLVNPGDGLRNRMPSLISQVRISATKTARLQNGVDLVHDVSAKF
jgi:hypothetical protein